MNSGFFSLFQLIDEPLVVIDGQGVITAANLSLLALLKREEGDVLGSPFPEFFHPLPDEFGERGHAFHHEAVPQFAKYREDRFSFWFKPVRGVAAISEDSWLVKLRNENGWSKLNRERDRLLELATLNEMLPTFLHELKNPLASVMALSELMLEELEEGETRESVAGILQESRRMKLAFEGLGNLSRNLNCDQEQDIGLALVEACAVFKPLFDRLGIELEVDLQPLPRLPLELGGIRGILFNLLNNAKQACRTGDRVTVEAGMDEKGKAFRFAVIDTGAGMSPEVLARCTDLFFTTKPMGSGMGMALCRTALKNLDGNLSIQSTLGQGTRVEASIPVTRLATGKD